MVDKKTKMTDWNLIARILSGEDIDQTFVDEEKLKLSEDFKASQEVWDLIDPIDEFNKIDSKSAFSKFKSKVNFEKPSHRNVRKSISLNRYIKIAASILIILGLATALLLRNTSQVILSSENSMIEKTLDDGSKIVLNKNSFIKYNKHFGKKHRKVIFSGEAYFEVAKNKNLPFIINTKNAKVEVVGTSFGLREIESDDMVSLSVNSGKVNFSSKKGGNSIVVGAGFVAKLDKKTREIVNRKNMDPNIFAWKTKELIFKETPLQEVAVVLEKVYDIKVQFNNERIKGLKLTANYNNQPLDNVLNIVSRTFSLEYNVNGREVYIFERK